MKPEQLRKLKTNMVHTPDSMEDLLNHPIVTTTPAGAIIVAMAMNTMLEQMARKLEDKEGDG